MADAVAEAPTEEATESPAPTTTESSDMKCSDVRAAIKGLTAENFSATLAKIEPFLVEEAGISIYSKSMRRIAVRAQLHKVEVPEGYAAGAKAIAKRVAKQNAFIQGKEEERLAAEAAAEEERLAAEAAAKEAAEAEAAAAEAAAEEPPAEEPAEEVTE
eukprot:CAMPEP_0113310188 /NCGR_PEP_ID=MMETSP0010_2-20120614/7935_1 /TAXON_ID=216773 ORGANISM="Corethron hystrix, Strain 308" /NCGR_SAMPLE_ID=MMETSP0010_2 /ASSEMBLY_ACC=CAM_ASM_000155 /LENGTH=158 /DNA_ID=CAMNT_0000165597 /DNA_START=312 /DNA_END=788 /DNA_ORIENTATION=- /assembly_acc=CAM_ASM_000155